MPAVSESVTPRLAPVAGSAPNPPTLSEEDKSDDRSPWWGWKTLGLCFVIWASNVLIYALTLNEELGSVLLQVTGLYMLHYLFIPFYSIFCLFRGDIYRAKESVIAGFVFFVLCIVFWVIIENAVAP